MKEHSERLEPVENSEGKPLTIALDATKIGYALTAGIFLILVWNQFAIASLTGNVKALKSVGITGQGTGVVNSVTDAQLAQIIPTGVPPIYGVELNVSYDDVSASSQAKADETIRKLGTQDVAINLTGTDLQRYIGIAGAISCEYCCGAESIIFPNGDAACGCAHSYAMRGVAKYLIKYHGGNFSDAQILEEMGKWKVLFFPGPHMTKARALIENKIDVSYVSLASNQYRGIEKTVSGTGSGSDMIGGC